MLGGGGGRRRREGGVAAGFLLEAQSGAAAPVDGPRGTSVSPAPVEALARLPWAFSARPPHLRHPSSS